MRFRFVSYSHPLSTLLAEKFSHFCVQADTDYIESGGSHACGVGVMRRLISELGVNLAAKANLSGCCWDVIL